MLFALVFAGCSGAPSLDEELLDVADASSGIDSDLAMLTSLLVTDSVGVAQSLSFLGCSASASPQAANTPTSGEMGYSFASCLVGGVGVVNGELHLIYTITGPTLHLDVQASGLTVDRAALASWSASADVTASNNDRSMVWQSQASGTATVHQSSRSFTDSGSATLKWNTTSPSCVDLDGQANDTFQASDGASLAFVTALSSYQACGSSLCPASGSQVRADLQSGNFVRLQYGEDVYTNEKGQTFSFVPVCAQ